MVFMKLHEDYLNRTIIDQLKDKGISEEKYQPLDIVYQLTNQDGYKTAERIAKEKGINCDVTFLFGTVYIKIENEEELNEEESEVVGLIKFFVQCALWLTQDEQFLVDILKDLDEDVLKELVKLYPTVE